MNILLVSGSPRPKGNSAALAQAFKEGVEAANPDATISQIALGDLTINGCHGCGYCKAHKVCVQQDDMQKLYPLIIESDALVYVTPVYWMGMTSQMKAFIDRHYALSYEVYAGKDLYAIAVGGDETDNEQYHLIDTQFRMMAEYLKMNYAGFLSASAHDGDPASNNAALLERARNLY